MSPPQKLLGLRIFLIGVQSCRQILASVQCIWMLGPKHFFIEFDYFTVKRLCLGIFPFIAEDRGQANAGRDRAWVFGSKQFFIEPNDIPIEQFRLGILSLVRERFGEKVAMPVALSIATTAGRSVSSKSASIKVCKSCVLPCPVPPRI